LIDRRIHNYRVIELISEGGMGTVYKAVHMLLGRVVAIKVLNPLLINKKDIKERFKSEAVNLSKLDHSNIIKIFDYIENQDGVFITLEYIEGKTFDEYIKEISGPIPENRAIKIFIQILDAVGYMHSKNIIHRDIKPGNFILNENDFVKIIDFGIAKTLGDENYKITKDGTKVGTTMYMSPQQIRGQILDRRTDIYSLGATFFEILTGLPPYDANSSEYDISYNIINEPFPNPKDYYIGISSKMQDVILKATAKRPLDRYQSCEEFKNAILNIYESLPQTKKLNTQIIEKEEIVQPTILNKTFWQNLIIFLVISAIVIFTGVVLFSYQKENVRQVIANSTFLYSGDSITAEKLEILDFGETIKLLSTDNSEWLKVESLRGKKGWVQNNDIANTKIFEQINNLFGDNYAQENTPVFYKKNLRMYFVENKFFSKITPDWKLYFDPKPELEINYICKGDFNANELVDFACVLKNSVDEKTKFLIFFDDGEENILIDFDEEIKIKLVKKGRDGGSWFLGNEDLNDKDITKTFEYLTTDGILLYKTKSDENLIYIYSSEEKILNVYQQND